jgi:hypothetical protein
MKTKLMAIVAFVAAAILIAASPGSADRSRYSTGQHYTQPRGGQHYGPPQSGRHYAPPRFRDDGGSWRHDYRPSPYRYHGPSYHHPYHGRPVERHYYHHYHDYSWSSPYYFGGSYYQPGFGFFFGSSGWW